MKRGGHASIAAIRAQQKARLLAGLKTEDELRMTAQNCVVIRKQYGVGRSVIAL
jgi:hypothetical protein